MRIDLYTKTILTLIVLLLAMIALKPIFQPQPAIAQGSLDGVQFCAIEGGLYAADMRTGDIWVYVTPSRIAAKWPGCEPLQSRSVRNASY